MDAHSDLVKTLVNFIQENGQQYLRGRPGNNWVSGMEKAICLINEYFKENEYEIYDKETGI